jgi:small-conductance mechanosensitive channel
VKQRIILAAALLAMTAACGKVRLPSVVTAKPATGSAEEAAIVRHLNAAITWYRELASTNESAGQPSDAFYLGSARSSGKQALQLAFESAEAEADLLATENAPEASGANAPAQGTQDQQALAKSSGDTAALIARTQAQIDTLDSQITNATGKRLEGLTSQRESLQEQLEFNKALQEALQKLSTFMNSNAGASGGLAKEIENLKSSLPDVFGKAPVKTAAPSNNSAAAAPGGAGLISQIAILFNRVSDLREVNQLNHDAARVTDLARQLQDPLRSRLRITIQQGRDLASQLAPADAAGREANRRQMIALTKQFKQLSSATIPLTQEIVLLQDSQASLVQWGASVHAGYIHILEAVMVRVVFLLAALGMVWAFSEVWLKATFRYVRDVRRRHQFLLVRRIVTAFLMAVVLVLGLVSEFSSLATFAGFLTAGIAVALQTLILSVAAYFFLIGRHGVKVGDRITVSGVTGDVIDVGMVRLSLMELGGVGGDLHPTGRVVVVSNSVLFQGVPFFKQIPGTAYAWHEVAVKLESGSDYKLAEDTLVQAVSSVYSQYRGTIEQQNQTLGDLLGVAPAVPSPQARLQLAENNLDLVVRYPVVLHREAEIDNEMAKRVAEVIDGLPQLKASIGTPTIRPANNS